MVLTYKQRFNKKYGFPLKKSHSIKDILNNFELLEDSDSD